MKRKWIILIFITVTVSLLSSVYLKSCVYFPIDGTVIDAETKQPIGGAVILVEWTIAPMEWLGMPTRYTYELIETTTDNNGKFRINSYVYNPLVDEPRLTIYKAGYVCWNNKYIFPDYEKRQDFRWTNNRKYEMDRFKQNYSHAEHVSFIEDFDLSLDARDFFKKAYEWERTLRQKEWGKPK